MSKPTTMRGKSRSPAAPTCAPAAQAIALGRFPPRRSATPQWPPVPKIAAIARLAGRCRSGGVIPRGGRCGRAASSYCGDSRVGRADCDKLLNVRALSTGNDGHRPACRSACRMSLPTALATTHRALARFWCARPPDPTSTLTHPSRMIMCGCSWAGAGPASTEKAAASIAAQRGLENMAGILSGAVCIGR